MINIEKEAEVYISELFADQSDDSLGLKIDVENPGTPMAQVSFNFCHSNDLSKKFVAYKHKGFDCYIHEDNYEYLIDAKVTLSKDGYAKKLSIYAPNAKGEEPGEEDSLDDRIKYLIMAEVNPQLASHGGFVELVKITVDMDVVLNFGGGCQGCSSVKVTLKNGVEVQIKDKFPEIRKIVDATDHANTENSYM